MTTKLDDPFSTATATHNKNVGGAPLSALATARNIDDIGTVQYPEGVMGPKPELNLNVKNGRFRYDRDFLLQFMGVCTQKPDMLPPFEAIGLEPIDQASLGMTRGGPGRHRQGSGAAAPSRQATVGLGFGPSSGLGKSSSTNSFSMGNFTTSRSKPSSDERFANGTSRSASVSAATGLPFNRPVPKQGKASQGGAGGAPPRDRTQSKVVGHRNEMNKGQQGHGSGFDNFQAKPQNVKLEPVAPLQMSANRWDKKAMQVDPDSPEIVVRKVRALLNKLTMDKFDSISDQVIAWANKSEKEKDGRTLLLVIRLVFEMATDQATWSKMYARLCRKMNEQISPKVQDDGIKNAEGKPIAGGQLFRKYLLNTCQDGFERGWVAKEVTTAAAAVKASDDEAAKDANQRSEEGRTKGVALHSDEYYAAQKVKRQGLGLIKFIGELFKLQMLTERIMHECVKKLLGNVENPEEEEIESSCTLLTTVGASLDTQKARAHMDVYFSRMKDLTKSQDVSSRVRLVLQDIIELRERKWISRKAVAAPATIAQIHETAAKEKDVGPDGWAVAASGSGPPRPAPKAGDLSNFGKISKAQPMTFGPGSVFAGKKGTESKRESISRPSSSSDMFSKLNQNTKAGADTTAKSEALTQTPKRLVLQPRFKLVEDAEAVPSNVESEVNSSEDEASPEMSDEDAKKKIAEDSKEPSEPQIQDFYEIPKTVDVARRRIDQDIEKMEGAIRALKSRRNSLAAISRLPPELLCKIFACCAATNKPAHPTMDWVKVTHVSRHWRTVAIGCPPLWTTLVFAQPRWMEEMLKRSKMAPLVFDARFGHMGLNLTEAVKLAMNHISRVGELSIVSPSACFVKLFSSVPRSAPMLQILALSTSTNYYAERFRDNYSIPPELFSDDSSQLRRLELIHCNLDWTSHLLKGLTHLKIHDIAPETRPSTPLFLDVLEQLPTLTVLDLKDALPDVADGSSTVSYQRNVKLRSLTNLHLAGSVSDCSNALRHLSVSSSAILKLSCLLRSAVASDAESSSVLTFVSGLWEPTAIIPSAAKPHRCPIRTLKIQGSAGFSLQAWPTVLSFQTLSGDPDSPPPIDLFFNWSSNVTPRIWDKVMGETCAALPLEQLALLDVMTANQITEETLSRRFGKLAHLRSIRAPEFAVHTLLSAMIAEPSTVTSTNVSANSSTWKRSRNRREMHPAVYFPSLLHLTIENTNFNTEYDGLKELRDCLMERCERKAEVRELTLSRCRGLTTEVVDKLREIVADVIWDGLETGFSDVSEDDYGDDHIDDEYYGDDIDNRSNGFNSDHNYNGFDSDGGFYPATF